MATNVAITSIQDGPYLIHGIEFTLLFIAYVAFVAFVAFYRT